MFRRGHKYKPHNRAAVGGHWRQQQQPEKGVLIRRFRHFATSWFSSIGETDRVTATRHVTPPPALRSIPNTGAAGELDACDPKKEEVPPLTTTKNRPDPIFSVTTQTVSFRFKTPGWHKVLGLVVFHGGLNSYATRVVDVSLLGGRKHPEEGLRGFPRCSSWR